MHLSLRGAQVHWRRQMCKHSGMSQRNTFSSGGVHSMLLGRERRERLLLPGDQDTLQELTFISGTLETVGVFQAEEMNEPFRVTSRLRER